MPTDPQIRDLGSLRVLVVDDNATNRLILHQQLASWGMESDEEPGAAAALARMKAESDSNRRYDIVVLDLNMPEMDGLELARLIGADPDLADAKLFLLSSSGKVSDAGRARVPARGCAVEAGAPVGVVRLPRRGTRGYDRLHSVGFGPGRDARPVGTAQRAHPARRGQRDEPARRNEDPREARLHRRRRRERTRRAREDRADRVRRGAHGLPDAGDGRLRGDAPATAPRARHRRVASHRHRHDRGRDGRRSRALPRGGHGRLRHQARAGVGRRRGPRALDRE